LIAKFNHPLKKAKRLRSLLPKITKKKNQKRLGKTLKALILKRKKRRKKKKMT
jgi:tRNA A37 methylthiotransferase MiaB